MVGVGAALAAAAIGVVLAGTPTQAFGTTPSAPRIVNGDETPAGQFDYMAALIATDRLAVDGIFQSQFCGAALTTPTTVVTAAHCVVDPATGVTASPSQIAVGIGRALRSDALRLVPVASIAVHPQFKLLVWTNDVAVLTLAEPVNDVPLILPVTADEAKTYTEPGTSAQVIGWGNLSADGNAFPETLRVGRVVVFPDTACSKTGKYSVSGVRFEGYEPADADVASMLCASGVRGSGEIVDSCQGDSGGPLIAGEGPGARLIGIVSWGEECASRHPGVYTRVSAMTNFLIEQRALPSIAPELAPQVTVEPLSSAARVVFLAAPDGAAITTFAATATNTVTGEVTTCFATPGPVTHTGFCVMGGLANGAEYSVTGIAAGPLGNSSAAAPVIVAPDALPDPGRITSVATGSHGTARFSVRGADGNGLPVLGQRVACLPLGGGPGRSGTVRDDRATVTGLRTDAYSCFATARTAVGTARSNPRIVHGAP